MILRSSEYLECDDCSGYNYACLTHKVFPKWDLVAAGTIPPVPADHVPVHGQLNPHSAVSTPLTPTAPPTSPGPSRNSSTELELEVVEQQIIQSVMDDSTGGTADGSRELPQVPAHEKGVFDSISLEDRNSLVQGFCDKLCVIYEYSKKDITDFLSSKDEPSVRANMLLL